MTARRLRDLLNAYYNHADPVPPDVQARLEQVVQAELKHRRERRALSTAEVARLAQEIEVEDQ